jgi:hypothetical protein
VAEGVACLHINPKFIGFESLLHLKCFMFVLLNLNSRHIITIEQTICISNKLDYSKNH